ncbi:probable protein S-acyltransferase 7 isoform X2 [Panicum virgatum]|uniref:probable protein S-acyltransferase 7 isoform X2 n=1 Tax=Panicum virgatum TaxID=38727 RepID=UPI0019D57873|nr:probable protein S-acyltransferase 7 isoform X2 [Panicum virgatum]
MQGKAQLSDSNRRIMEVDAPPRRVYQAWKGSNLFFLGGRLIFGPDVRSLVLTVCLIVTPVIFFAAAVCPQLGHEFQSQIGGWVASVAVIFTAYILLVLLLTSGRDPGIVPRNAHPPEPEDIGESPDWPGGQHGSTGLPLTRDVLVNGVSVKVKYCHTCMLYRPPRCSHCSICNNCVERFDHHCPWVGQCIGKRNYRFFFMFVSSTTLLCIYVFAFCWVNIKRIMDMHECKIGGLTSFHLYLISTNQTTYENFRYRYDRKTNPYNLGVAQNFIDILFSRIPSSKNNFRAKVKEDSATFTSSLSMGRVLSPPKMSVDLEMGTKRQAVAAEDLEDLHSQISSAMGLERCGTEPPHFVGRKGCSEISSDIEAFAEEFGMERELSERKKIERRTNDGP